MKKDNNTSSTNSATLDAQKTASTPRNATSTSTTSGNDNNITSTTIVSSSNTLSNNLYSSPLNQSFTDLLMHEEDSTNVAGSPKDSSGRKSVCSTPPMSAIPKIIESPSPTSSRYSIKSRLSIDNSYTSHHNKNITNTHDITPSKKQGRSGSMSSVNLLSHNNNNNCNTFQDSGTLPALANVLQEDSYSECEEYPTTERLLQKLKKSTSSNTSSVGSSSPIKKIVMSSGDIGVDMLFPSSAEDGNQGHGGVETEDKDTVKV
jgi:hypothetical protein